MRMSLLYNRQAGANASLGRIRAAAEREGHHVVSVIEQRDDVPHLIEDRPDIAVAAGGDATIALAARTIMGRGIPLAILPLGTANNIARSLGIQGSIEQLVGKWDKARRAPLDLGVAEGAWGQRTFVEGIGVGLVPAAIADMQTRSDGDELPIPTKLAGAIRATEMTLGGLQPVDLTVTVDGTRIEGTFFLVEVMNMRSTGANLVLSADATPSDGFFDVVMANREYRQDIERYLREVRVRHDASLRLPSTRARHVSLQGASTVRLDDEVLPTHNEIVSLRMVAAALEVLV